MVNRLIVAAILSVMAITSAYAEVAQRRVALVVANAAYRDAALHNPTVDADLIRPALERMGFDVTVVRDADLAAFAIALESFYDSARGADVALFYFAGHGFALNDKLVGAQNYLMSLSADVTSNSDVIIRSGSIPLDEVIVALADVAQVSLIFIDACRNDPRISRGDRSGRGLTRMSEVETKSTFIGLSTRPNSLADDGDPGAGSPFTLAFAGNMPRPGLRLDDAFRLVRQAVSDHTNGEQHPEARDDLNVPLVLVPPALNSPGPLPDPPIDAEVLGVPEALAPSPLPTDAASNQRLEAFVQKQVETNGQDPVGTSALRSAVEAYAQLTPTDRASAGPAADVVEQFSRELTESKVRLEAFLAEVDDTASEDAFGAYDQLTAFDKNLSEGIASDDAFRAICQTEKNLTLQVQKALRQCRGPSALVPLNGAWARNSIPAARGFLEDAKYLEWIDKEIEIIFPSIELRDLILKVISEGYGPVCAQHEPFAMPVIDIKAQCERLLFESSWRKDHAALRAMLEEPNDPMEAPLTISPFEGALGRARTDDGGTNSFARAATEEEALTGMVLPFAASTQHSGATETP